MENKNILENPEIGAGVETIEGNSNELQNGVENQNEGIETVENESTPLVENVESENEPTNEPPTLSNENELVEQKEEKEGEKQPPLLTIPILQYSEIKSFCYNDGVNERMIRYADFEGQIIVCADDFLGAVVGKIKKYQQLKELEKMGIDARSEQGADFVSLKKLHNRLYRYDIAKTTYDKDPSSFAPYVRFVANGGMNAIAQIFGVDFDFGEPKDLFYLGVDISAFASEKTDTPQPTAEKEKAVIAEKSEPQTTTNTSQPPAVTEKQFKELFKTVESSSRLFSDVLKAIELNKTNSDANFKHFETTLNGLKSQQNGFSESFETLLKNQMYFESRLNKLQSEKVETVASEPKEKTNRLKSLLTDQSVWMYLAMVVTLIFLPFTVMGLYKHIHIATDTWYSAFFVGLLCFAIAFVWDMAIFFFAINGKTGMAGFGSLVQVVFFSAKFNLLSILAQDGLGLNGEYWQNLIVIIFAVIYSPLLLANLTHLSVSQKTEIKK